MGEAILTLVIFVFGILMAGVSLLAFLGGLYYTLIISLGILYLIAHILIYPASKICAIYATFISKTFNTYKEALDYFELYFENKINASKDKEEKHVENIKAKVNERRKLKEEKKDAKRKKWRNSSYLQGNKRSSQTNRRRWQSSDSRLQNGNVWVHVSWAWCNSDQIRV